jgi:hypothetical protein
MMGVLSPEGKFDKIIKMFSIKFDTESLLMKENNNTLIFFLLHSFHDVEK